MNILLTNDDGIAAQGINVLYRVLSEKHNVFIIAPDEEKSGTSSAITIKQNLLVKSISENIFTVNGFTADCVNVGLIGNIIPKVDMVVSGINHGQNIGDDIYFSGTVAGARLACIYGKSGIAISLNCREESEYFFDASKFLLGYIENSDLPFTVKNHFLNINYPDLPPNKILGIKYSSLSRNKNNDTYKIISKNNGEIYLRYSREGSLDDSDGSDIADVSRGYITITPLIPECTDFDLLSNLSSNTK